MVLGVSTDDLASHQRFCEKYDLPFPLLSDTDHDVAQRYGVWKLRTSQGRQFMGVERTTFVIDPHGIVRKIFPQVKVEGHPEEVLQYIDAHLR